MLSNDGDVHSSGAFLALLNVEGNLGTFVKGLEARTVDSGVVYEYVGSILLLDETKTLRVVEPFYNSVCHSDFSSYILGCLFVFDT